MNEEEPMTPPPAEAVVPPSAGQPVNEKFRELAVLEEEIRRRLRSNQRFLEKFLDEDFVDDEAVEDDGEAGDDEEL
ncbi:MAG: hypothetical protein NDI73_05050 [Desulfuromonadales bacterium]|nr:hypothetical protein [Desulfuromonadales bacterium]